MPSTHKDQRKHIPAKLKLGMFICSLIALFLCLLGVGLYSTSASLPIEGRPPELYATQCRDDLCLHLKQALKEAKKTILVVIFALTDKEIIQTLRAKAEEGVKITVIYDSSASSGLKGKLGKTFKQSKDKRFQD